MISNAYCFEIYVLMIVESTTIGIHNILTKHWGVKYSAD